MNRNDVVWLLAIIGIVAVSIWISLSPNYPIQPGLDLQGGLQVLLEADVPESRNISQEEIETVRQIISQRINGLGVSEPLIQVEGDRRIIVELPGIENVDDAISLIQGTALLEFVNTGQSSLPEGMCIRTSLNEGPSDCEVEGGAEPPTFETVITGAAIASANPSGDQFSYYVLFSLRPEAATIFEEYTKANQGRFLTITLDKKVISSPRISAVISDNGTITGNFTAEDAQNLSLQLKYGSLPVPMRIESTREVGATLGSKSIDDSIKAGTIGLIVVLLFMLIYYRLPGLLADFALIIYALINFALFKFLGVSMTLPAITGFLLSTGMAVDANILVFERMKEELRKGSLLQDAIESGFSRAWTSIRDSNIATLVICLILWFFGRNFGASIVQGFAITLSIGVLISMFTAVVVTRTFIRIVIGRSVEWLRHKKWLLGV